MFFVVFFLWFVLFLFGWVQFLVWFGLVWFRGRTGWAPFGFLCLLAAAAVIVVVAVPVLC